MSPINGLPGRLLTIDPGIARIGYCVFDKVPLEYGTFISVSEHKQMNASTIDSLSQVFPKIRSIIEGYRIQAIALEQVPGGVKMAQRDKVLSTQGMMRTLSMHYKIPYAEFNARRLKNLFLKDSKASKDDIRAGILDRWGIDEKSPDTNDAIMIATVSSEIALSDEKVWWRWDQKFEK